jgi:hypothetical protein
MLRRVLVLRLRADAAADDVRQLEEALRSLPAKIPDIREWHLSRNLSSMRPGQRPYSHVWEVTFSDLDALRRYQTDPYHAERVHPFFDKSNAQCVVEEYFAVYYEVGEE